MGLLRTNEATRRLLKQFEEVARASRPWRHAQNARAITLLQHQLAAIISERRCKLQKCGPPIWGWPLR